MPYMPDAYVQGRATWQCPSTIFTSVLSITCKALLSSTDAQPLVSASKFSIVSPAIGSIPHSDHTVRFRLEAKAAPFSCYHALVPYSSRL